MPVQPIDSIADPRIAVYRGLKYQVAKRGRHWFVVEGLNLAERLLGSGLPVLSVITEATFVDRLLPQMPEAAPLYVASHALIEELAGFQFHRGVLACGTRPAPAALESFLSDTHSPVLLSICVGVQDPENVGGIIRTSAACGAQAVLLGPGVTDAYSRRVARTSMGNIFRLPIRHSEDLRADLLRLQSEFQVQLVATVLDEAAEPLGASPPPRRAALLFGSEGFGLEPQWLELCDRRMMIPMQSGVDSLNVNVAAGIFLYHFGLSMRGGAANPELAARALPLTNLSNDA